VSEENITIDENTAQEQQNEQAELTCEEKLKEAEDKYLRVHADFENIKKRLEKEKYQAIDYASEKFAKDLLPVIDTLELALNHMQNGSDMEKLKEGVQLTLDNLTKVFERHGISVIGHEEGFDPNVHEAVMQGPSEEHEDNQIVAVFQKGYKLKDRMLRPSLVNVCKK
jgi:molecular chaperone GrpE